MRLNLFIAKATGMSRRAADTAINSGRVRVNGQKPKHGQQVTDTEQVTIDGQIISVDENTITIMLNKPVGYVCSRAGQGSKTIYDLLPAEYHKLKPVGRLDKSSSGLLLLTNDGKLAHKLTHPSHQKTKVYEVKLDKLLLPLHQQMISDYGVNLEDGPSKLIIQREDTKLIVSMHEGRNRQIRRTFEALGYEVVDLHRIHFGSYHIGTLPSGKYINT